MSTLNTSHKIRKLTLDLNLKSSAAPVQSILAFCEQRVRKFLKDFRSCSTPAELLEILAAKLNTCFEIIRSDQDLLDIKNKYVEKKEPAFAALESEFPADVYGVTFKRLSKKPWEPDYVSVIDARNEKVFRSNYTKWHELGHLLILTDQMRLSFSRSFCTQDLKDPEESLVDVIAGHFAFWSDIFAEHVGDNISFNRIEEVRLALCPEASKQSALLGLVRIWKTPCVLVEARLSLKKEDQRKALQGHFGFQPPPQQDLRIINVTVNEPAKAVSLRMHRHWRVPDRSVISDVFHNTRTQGETVEDLNLWMTSSGSRLATRRVRVEARQNGESVLALITPVQPQ